MGLQTPSRPATVLTFAVEMLTTRMSWFVSSVTYKSPFPSGRMPRGALNVAAVPIPSLLPANVPLALPPPARVDTVPALVLMRRILLRASVT